MKLTFRRLDNNWIEGSYGPYSFQAKVFDEPSTFGIDKGRVSKLMVRKSKAIIFNYDRGLDIDHPIGRELAGAIENEMFGVNE